MTRKRYAPPAIVASETFTNPETLAGVFTTLQPDPYAHCSCGHVRFEHTEQAGICRHLSCACVLFSNAAAKP